MEFAGLADLLRDVYGTLIISGWLVFPHRRSYCVCWLNMRRWLCSSFSQHLDLVLDLEAVIVIDHLKVLS